ncbi:hypothetical protein [Roseicyclus mahoneyensis]|uniref:Uncharacterized protein n=1 Tax=Roseicyclus mahoneyensis TaxID=164332 RepID=A0A316GH96_9RHOB|nr:hypothetical protein [Roseicyclus mahoneyensis]PWK60443.1 hypothetical protein C7455_10479 [Roseicyclus mahoneyensis]
MPNDKPAAAKAHTELRRRSRPEEKPSTEAEVPKLKPRVPEDRVPGGDEDDLFNDMPV